MKVKVISLQTDSKNRDLDGIMESGINAWLSENPTVEVIDIKINTELAGHLGKGLVTILYKEGQ